MLEPLEQRVLLSTVTWDGGGDGTSWNDPLNWDTDAVPGAAADVIIDSALDPTVVIGSGAAPVNSLTSQEVVTIGPSATLDVASASSVTDLNLGSGGTLTGTGDMTVTGALSWTGGTMSGAGRTIVDAGATLTIDGNSTKYLQRELAIDGDATWTNGSVLFTGGTLTNNGTFTANFGTTEPMYGQSGMNVFTNNGQFTKQGMGTAEFRYNGANVVFDNAGMVTVDAGTLALDAGGTHSGSFDVQSGAFMNIGAVSGNSDFGAGATVTGAGTLRIERATNTFADTVDIGDIIITGGSTTFNGAVTSTGGVTASSSGSATFSGATAFDPSATIDRSGSGTIDLTSNDVTVATAGIGGGTLTGSGDVTVTGSLSWTGGTMAGLGRTIAAMGGTLTINGNSTKYLRRELVVGGDATWTNGTVLFTDGTLTNNGTFTADFGTTEAMSGQSGTNVFTNNGQFTKQGTGSAEFRYNGALTRFDNAGMVMVEAGTLALDAGGTHSGAFDIQSGAFMNIGAVSGNSDFGAGATVTGAGTLRIEGATNTFADTVDIGDIIVTGGSTTFNGAVTSTGGVTASSSGSATFSGATAFGPSATIDRSGSGTIDLTTNNVTVATASMGGGTLTGSGDVTVTGSLSWTGGTMAGLGRTIAAMGGALTIDGNSTKYLQRELVVDGGATWINGTVYFNDGTLTNNGAFTADFDTTEAMYGQAGTNVFTNNGQFTKQGTGIAEFRYNGALTRFDNAGMVTVEAGTLALDAGGTHSGAFDIQSGAFMNIGDANGNSDFGLGATVTGAGTLRIEGATNTFADTVNVRDIIVTGGSTIFSGSVTSGGGVSASFNGSATFSGVTVFDPSATIDRSGSGTIDLTSNDVTVATASISGGTLTGSGDVTVTGSVSWTGGSIIGAGRMFVAVGGTLTIDGNPTKYLRRELVVDGDATWLNGTMYFNDGTLTNNGAFTADFDTTEVMYGQSGTNVFTNNGQFTKQGTGSAEFRYNGANVVFDNAGMVTVDAGTLAFDAGGTHSGSFDVQSGAVMSIGAVSGNSDFGAGATVTGAGTLRIEGATNTFADTVDIGDIIITGGSTSFNGAVTSTGGVTASFSGSATFSGATVFDPSATIARDGSGTIDLATNDVTVATASIGGGTLTGSGDVTVTGSVSWTGGSIIGAGRMFVAAGGILTIEGNPTKHLRRELVVDGDATWLNGTVYFNNGTLTNNGTFTADFDTTEVMYGQSGTNVFTNNGQFTKMGAGTAQFRYNGAFTLFDNAGTATVEAGTLYIADGSQANISGSALTGGEWIVMDGATIDMQSASIDTIGATASVTLDGTGSAFAALSPLATIEGGLSLSGGGDFAAVPAGGVFTVNGSLSLGAGSVLSVTGDYVQAASGSLSVVIAGTDTTTGFGRVEATGGATLDGSLTATVDSFTPALGDTFDVVTGATRTGQFDSVSLPTPPERRDYYVNYLPGAAQIELDYAIGVWTGFGDGTNWTDAANWARDTIPDATIDAIIDLSGSDPTVVISSGDQAARSLLSTEALTLSGGSLDVAAASQVDAPVMLSGGTLTGAGDVAFTGGLTWTAGTMSGTGVTTVAQGTTLTLSGIDAKAVRRDLIVAGDTTWTGGDLIIEGTVTNDGAFTADTAATLDAYRDTAGASTLANNGSFTKQGAGTVQFRVDAGTVAFDNAGSVSVLDGTLGLDTGGTQTAPFAVNGHLRLGGDQTLSVLATISGTGSLELISGGLSTYDGDVAIDGGLTLNGGVAMFHGAVTAADLTVNAGNTTFSGSATFAAATTLTVAGGTTTFSGVLDYAAGADLSLSGGTLSHSSNDLTFADAAISGGTISGSGSVTFTGTVSWADGTMSGSGTTTFAPGGTLVISGTGTRFAQRDLILDGDTSWTGGSLRLHGTATNNGVLTLDTDATIQAYRDISGTSSFLNNGSFIKQGTGSAEFVLSLGSIEFVNAGTLQAAAGTFRLVASSQADLSGGTLTGGTWIVRDGATIDFDAASVQAIGSGVSVTLDGAGAAFAALSGLDTVEGTLTLSNGRAFTTAGSLDVSGQVTVESGGALTVTGALDNAGTMTVDGSTLTAQAGGTQTGQFVLANGATLDLAGDHTFEASAGISGDGDVILRDGTHTVDGAISISGSLTVQNASVTFNAAASAGSFSVDAGSSVTIDADVTVASAMLSGTVDVGPGAVVSATGNVTLASTTDLTVRAAATTSGQFGRISAGGQVALAGTFQVVYVGGFTAVRGDSMQLIAGSAVTGSFSATAAAQPTPQTQAVIRVNSTSVDLEVLSYADTNQDGTVDVFDLLDYLTDWFAGSNAAERDGASGITVFDLLSYLELWFADS